MIVKRYEEQVISGIRSFEITQSDIDDLNEQFAQEVVTSDFDRITEDDIFKAYNGELDTTFVDEYGETSLADYIRDYFEDSLIYYANFEVHDSDVNWYGSYEVQM